MILSDSGTPMRLPLVGSEPWAALSGVITGIVFATILFAYSPYAWLTAFGCLFFGLIAQLPGEYVIKVIQKLRQWIGG